MKEIFLILISLVFITSNDWIHAQKLASGPQSNFAFFICQSGSPSATGINNKGQLGDGTILDKQIPVQIGFHERCPGFANPPDLGIGEEKKTNYKLNLFPNPSSKIITLEIPLADSYSKENDTKISVYNSVGKESLTIDSKNSKWIDDKLIIDISELKKGIYNVKILSKENCGYAKFIKE